MNRTVVKLGGSTAGRTEMRDWIDALQQVAGAVALVPGGGPFAKLVREQERPLALSAEAAHAMAILAMEQFGHVILDAGGRLAPARSLADFETAFAAGDIPVWLPSTLALAAAEVPASWSVTSDLLAAWLAGRLGASRLLLVKQTSAFSAEDDVDMLSARGVVDGSLPAMLHERTTLYLAHPGDLDGAVGRLEEGLVPGTAIAGSRDRRRAS